MQMPAVVSIIALSAGAGVRIGSAVRTGIVVFKIGWAVPRARKQKSLIASLIIVILKCVQDMTRCSP